MAAQIKDIYENVGYSQGYPKNNFQMSINLQKGKKGNYIVVYTTENSGLYKGPASNKDKYKLVTSKSQAQTYIIPLTDCIKVCELNEITDKIIIDAVKRKQVGWLNSSWVRQSPSYQNLDGIDWIL